MRQTRNSIYSSAIALVLCIVMLTGTTFAWFTDTATSSGNVVQSGRLDAELYWSNELLASDSTAWIDASDNSVFTHNNWEPGYTDVKYIKVKNNGTLNFKWRITVEADGPVTSLSDVIDVYYVNPVTSELTSLEGLTSVGTLTEVMMNKTNSTGRLTPGQDAILAIAFHMDELAGNEYQNTSLCDNGFSLKLLATQDIGEQDSFGDDYDLGADWEEGSVNFTASASLSQVPLIYGALAGNVTIGDQNGVNAFIPTGVKVADGASSLDLSINRVDDDNITLDDGDTASSLDVHIEGVAADNTVPMTVHLGAVLQPGLDETELKLYHIENGAPVLMTRVNTSADFAVHNQYTYNSATGEVSIYVATFSVFSAVRTSADEWDGTSDTTWYNENDTEFTLTSAEQLAGFRDLVDGGNTFAGKTIKLGADIDLADKPFDPIGFGYYKDDKVIEGQDKNTVFMGTFDGGNHTIYNLYENCWELDPDKTNYSTYTYSTAGAGLFASIKNATIKNLAISGAEIVFECVDMGIVVGYAQGECHFENIVVTNSKIANYNRYTGGVVGEVSYGVDNNKDGYSHTFKNVVVDSTVTVSGLWGSFGCGMGGVIGGKWGDATVLMENVISAPKMDVYNDVVSAYQWYAFRGCGMLIGHTEEPYSDGRHSGNATANFLTCENVKVYYGDWVNYTYYEFENQDNATGQRYPWVRAEKGEYCDAFSNIRYGVPTHNGVKVSDLTEEELKAVATDYTPIIFDQLYGADLGMYGTAKHDGVEVIYNAESAKTIYILNDQSWENLKLNYWYRNGEDTWTTVGENGVSMDNMELSNFDNVYRLRLPAYVDGFEITADGENKATFTLAQLGNDGIYTLDGEAHDHSYTDGKCVCGAYKIQKCELVTDVTSLHAGDKIIIVAVNSDVALSTTQNSNNRAPVAIVKNADDTITFTADVQVITLEAGNSEGTFAFNVGTGYLYAAGSSNNTLKTETELSDNSSWSITIDQSGVATVKAQGTNSRNWLRYNNTSSLFSCYGSGQQDIAIYKISSSDEIIEAHNCYDFALGATCEDNAVCSKCSNEIADSALGHDYVAVEKAPTCTDAGYITYTCSRCKDDYRADGDAALGHNYVDAVCSACGAIDSSSIDFSGRYYIATIRTTGNYFYMTNSLGDASTKRYQAIDSELTILPEEIASGESNKIFVLEKNEDGTYSIYAEGVEGNKYLGWKGDNSGTLVAEEDALKLTVDKKEDGTYNIHFTGDFERYLALNQNSGSNYFAWYKSGQKQDLSLIPVQPCDHNYESDVTAPTCTADGFTTHTCTECGDSYTDSTVPATGHVNTTTTTVNATCTTAGSTTITCDDCDAVISTETIPTIAHTDVNTDNDHNCDACGVENVTEHNYVDGACDCGATEPVEPTHECESKCAECGKCTDEECTEDACTDKCEGHSTVTTPTWALTNLADIKSTDIVVIVWTTNNGNGTSYAISSANGSSSAPTAVKVTVDGNTLTGDIADNIKWNISNNNGSLIIYPNGDTSKWLYCTDTNNGVRVGTNTNKTFTIDATSGYLKNTATSRYVGVYTANPDVRCYTNTTGNTANQTLAFYVYNEGTSGGDNGGETTCQHTNTTTTTTATCVSAGTTTVTCDDCGATVSTEEVDALGHTTDNGTCERCGETIGGTEPVIGTLAEFTFGANGSASHADGNKYSANQSWTVGTYTLKLTTANNVYGPARDAKGNSAIKLGTSSATGNFVFTVGDDVTEVVIYVAQYKANTTKITVNGASYTISTASNNGAYTAITVDTSVTKTVSFATVSGGVRCMIDTIEFKGNVG